MKRITILIDDNKVDLSETGLNAILGLAKEFRVETIETGEPIINRIKRNYIAGSSLKKVVMDHYTPDGVFTMDKVSMWGTAVGYAKNSLHSCLRHLCDEGFIRQLGKGKFQFIKPYDKAV